MSTQTFWRDVKPGDLVEGYQSRGEPGGHVRGRVVAVQRVAGRPVRLTLGDVIRYVGGLWYADRVADGAPEFFVQGEGRGLVRFSADQHGPYSAAEVEFRRPVPTQYNLKPRVAHAPKDNPMHGPTKHAKGAKKAPQRKAAPKKAAPKPKAPKAAKKPARAPKVPKAAARPALRLPPNTPDLACDDPTLGQVVDLRQCELPPGAKRRKCSTVRSVVVGCATPSADKPKRKQMYAVPQGRRYIVGVAEVNRALRAGERARVRLDLPNRQCEDYTRARARGIPVSEAAYAGEECARFDGPEPTAFAPRPDDPWEQTAPLPVAPAVHAPAPAPAPAAKTGLDDPRLERWVLEYMANQYPSAFDQADALDSLQRLSGSPAFARAMLAGWKALTAYDATPSVNDAVGVFRDAVAEARGAKPNGAVAPARRAYDQALRAAYAANERARANPTSAAAMNDARRRWDAADAALNQLVAALVAATPRWRRRPGSRVANEEYARSVARGAKGNDARKAAAPRGVAVPVRGNDPMIGRVVGGEDFAGFVRSPATGCEGGRAYIVGGEVVPRSKVVAAIRKAEIAAGLREPPPPRGARATDATRAPTEVVGVRSAARPASAPRAPLALPAPGYTSHQPERRQSFGAGSADSRRDPNAGWAAARVGNVVEFVPDGTSAGRMQRRTRGVVMEVMANPSRNTYGVELYAMEHWLTDSQSWHVRPRQDSARFWSDSGRLHVIAAAEPRAGDNARLMQEYARVAAAYSAAARTMTPREASFRELPMPEAVEDLRLSAARLAEILAEEAATARPSVRPLPPRAPRSAAPVHVVAPAIRAARTLEQRIAAERKDASPAWDEAQVGDVVEFNSTTQIAGHLRGRVAGIIVDGPANARVRTGVLLDQVKTLTAGRWKDGPAGRHTVLNTKGTLVFVQRQGRAPSGPVAGDDAALMEQFETLREGLGFYGAEGVAPSTEAFAALPLSAARSRIAALEDRLQTERERMAEGRMEVASERSHASGAPGEPDFGAFITGAKANRGAWGPGQYAHRAGGGRMR